MMIEGFYVKLDGAGSLSAAAAYKGFLAKEARAAREAASFSYVFEKTLTLDSDTVAQIIIHPGCEEIRIRAGSPGVDVLSGMTDGSTVQSVAIPGKGTQDQLFRFQPGSIMGDATRAFRLEPKLVVDAFPQNVRIDATNARYAQTANVEPAMYTGKMTKVAQLAMGLAKTQIQYQHGFFTTHGIFTDAKERLWLVEISIYNGVRAMLLPSYAQANSKKLNDAVKAAGIPVIPNGKAFPQGEKLQEAMQAGRIRQLLDPQVMFDWYAIHIPFYSDCGWAFSESGRVAVNTSWNNIQQDDYKRSYLHQIQISGDDTGPIAATLSQISTGIIYNNSDSTRFYVPTGISTDIATFSMKSAGFIQRAPDQGWGGPLHAFFVGESMKVYEHKIYKGQQGTPATNGWSPYDAFLVGGAVNVGSDFGYTPIAKEAYITSNNNSEVLYNDSIDFAGPGVPAPSDKNQSQAQMHKIYAAATGPYLAAPNYVDGGGGSIDGFLVTRIFTVVAESSSQDVPAESVRNSLVVSPKNRSCVFVGTTTFRGPKNSTQSKKFLGFITKVGESFDVWTNDANPSPPAPFYNAPWRLNYSGQLPAKAQNTYGFVLSGGAGIDYNRTVTVTSGNGVAGTSIYFPKPVGLGQDPNDPFNLGNDMTLSTSYEPVTGYGDSSSSTPSSRIYGYQCLNGPTTASETISTPEQITKFNRIFAPSPDEFGTFATMHSGRSAFKGSHFHSKNQGENMGDGLRVAPADGEDMAMLTSLVSWVGYM